MEERYNPMKSAEIATEHNYNMLDGVLNNQAPPPEEKRSWIRLRNRPTSAEPGTGGTMTKKRRRPIHLHVMVSEEEQALIQQRMAEAGIRNMGAYIRKMGLNGYVLHVTSRPSGSWYRSSGGAQTTSIKWRSRPTPTAEFIPEEIAALQRDYAALWEPLSDLLKKLSALVELCTCRGVSYAAPRFSLLRDNLFRGVESRGKHDNLWTTKSKHVY